MRAFFIKHKKSTLQFGKFIVVGAINFLVDFGIFKLLTVVFGMLVAPANVISYTSGVVNSFLLNRYWTFKIKHKFVSVHFVKFVFVNLVSLGVNTLAVWVLVELYRFSDGFFGVQNLYAKLIATVFSFTVNFAGNKFLVFKDDKSPSIEE
ncbi:MAG: GtrA family protein [Clostridia bacterium]|nr:GtrA family protein [Clostridia bacterium]MBT7122309.1 GtrA family protein [Clostridia bacterium]